MKKKILLICLVLISLFINIDVYAKSVSKDDIPTSSYVIGTHVFTRDSNIDEGYEGKLTTQYIMLASRTIDSDNIDDMVIYYKTASGMWIDGLTGESLSVPDTFNINYTNVSLEEENDTVSAPKAPILFALADGNVDTDTDSYYPFVYVLIDDFEDTSNIVDGVELIVREINSEEEYEVDLKYDEKFKGSTIQANDNFEYDIDGFVIGKKYHYYTNYFKFSGEDAYVKAVAYRLDANGKKVYSEQVTYNITDDDYFRQLKVINTSGDNNYVYKEENNYIYSLGVELTRTLSAVDKNKFKFIINQELDNGKKQIGIYDLNSSALVSIPENSVYSYSAKVVYYDNDGKLVSFDYDMDEEKTLTIDTRKLSTPVLSIDSSSEEVKVFIDEDSYREKEEDTLDYNYSGVEFFEYDFYSNLRLLKNSKVRYINFYPIAGQGVYFSRVYATNALGNKVYSELSNKEEVIVTPIIEVTDLVNGKAAVSIKNYSRYTIGSNFKVNIINSSGSVLTKGDLFDNSTNKVNTFEISGSAGDKIYAYISNNSLLNWATIINSTLSKSVTLTSNLYGDVNGDSYINDTDKDILSRYLSSSLGDDDIFISTKADVNGDGKIDNVDLLLLNRYISGSYSESEFPIKQLGTTYKIEYMVDNNVYATDYQLENYIISKIDDPIKYGYIFNGWFIDEDLSIEYNFDTNKVSSDMKLYAKFTEATYGDVNGDGNINTLDVTLIGQYLCNTLMSDVVFISEKADVNGDGLINNVDQLLLIRYLVGDYDDTDFPNTQLGTTYKIECYVDGDLYTTDYQIENYTILRDINVSTKDGYYFDGWYTDEDFINKFDFDNTKINKDYKLYGRYVKINYGDANDDGVVNGNDLSVLNKYINGLSLGDGESFNEYNADVNADGKVDMVDVTLLRKYFANNYVDKSLPTDRLDKYATISYIYTIGNQIDEIDDYDLIGYNLLSTQVPEMEEIEGYTFDGWYLDSNYSNKFEFDNVIDYKLLILYGRYVEN